MQEMNGFIGQEKDNPRVDAQNKGKIAVNPFKNIPPAHSEGRKDGFSGGATFVPKAEGTLDHPANSIKI
jgi:hypothetical protein